jgi:hypothetical protein
MQMNDNLEACDLNMVQIGERQQAEQAAAVVEIGQ